MTATFFLSTGRCGTQSLTSLIQSALPSPARVEHEPVKAFYKPRLTLRDADFADLAVHKAAAKHLRKVCQDVRSGLDYVETGWPAFSWYRQYRRELGELWRYVHLVRNPVDVAGSLVTHRFYAPGREDNFMQFAALHPSDDGVIFPKFQTDWAAFSVFEKCLYQWLEINAYAVRLEDDGIAPVARVRFEDVFADESRMRTLFATLGWTYPPQAPERVDQFHKSTTSVFARPSEELWAEVVRLAARFGYAEDDLEQALGGLSRYHAPRRNPAAS